MERSIDWNAAYEDFMAGIHASMKPKTELMYRSQLRQLIAHAKENDVGLGEYKARHFRAYMAMRSDLVSLRTQLHDCYCARVFFRFCLHEGYSETNPLSDYVFPRPPKPITKCATQEQLEKLLRAVECRLDVRENREIRYMAVSLRHFVRVRDSALYCFVIETGCRIGEVLSLCLADLDRESGSVTFRSTKSNEDRRVPITGDLLSAMKAWLVLRDRLTREVRADLARGQAPRCCDNLFLNQFGNPLQQSIANKSLHKYQKYAGIASFNFHDIRRYTLTRLAEKSVLSAKEIAGHKSLATTQGYLHPREEQVRADHAEVSPLGRILQTRKTAATKRRKKIV